MAISRLSLTDFRNHADALLAPGQGFVVLTGENGAGKTNVLEAVSLLAPGKGLRRASLTDMARQGGSGAFGVAARIEGAVDLVPQIIAGQRDMAPGQRRDLGEKRIGDRGPLVVDEADGAAEIDGVLQDNRVDDEVEARGAIGHRLGDAVAQFAELMKEHLETARLSLTRAAST